MLKVRLFHNNLVYIGTPIFALWYTLITGKLICIAYRLKIIILDIELGEQITLWTADSLKMVSVESTNGLEILLIGGFLVWHFGFSLVFGAFAVIIERVIASMLINNYELNDSLTIPIVLTVIYQFFALSISFLLLFNKFGPITLVASVVFCFGVSTFMYFYIKRINERWLAEMEDPRRNKTFTVSQRFQVRENLRAIGFGKRIVYTVMFSLAVIGFGILALFYEIVPPFLLHIGENLMFCHPLFVCIVTMYGHPTWKAKFRRAFPRLRFKKAPIRVTSVDIVEDNMKKMSLETDIYFKQLKDLWV
ncbi:hypothetical protein B9Z55_006926 [Caenorhabditis nigoni]|uniref:Uncharacterized protein n=1 Tax=Caenorhabditis nigoni TaxID=1611254 RepID=A0A2G5V7D7_9PELO|nr:hypothetical protein B9Z55_006926 [Caenorhabditis nigoni]